MTAKIRTQLNKLYKDFHSYDRLVDEDNLAITSVFSHIVVPLQTPSYSYGLIYAIKNSLSQDDVLFDLFNDNVQEMTYEYYLNQSGMKYIAPIYEQLLEIHNNDLNVVDDALAKIILNRFHLNWVKRYEAYLAEYNPLFNYDMEETRRDNIDVTEAIDGYNDVYGYNSNDASPSNKTNDTRHTTGSQDKNYRKTERKGNIGVTTSQKMLTDELEVRKYDLINAIYRDIDKVVVLSVY